MPLGRRVLIPPPESKLCQDGDYSSLREQPNQSDAVIATLITGVRADGLSGLRSDSFWMKHPNRSGAQGRT